MIETIVTLESECWLAKMFDFDSSRGYVNVEEISEKGATYKIPAANTAVQYRFCGRSRTGSFQM